MKILFVQIDLGKGIVENSVLSFILMMLLFFFVIIILLFCMNYKL